jgi:hypothetical protein
VQRRKNERGGKDKVTRVVWSIRIVFSLFLVSFIFFKCSELKREVDGSFISEKEGQIRKVKKIGVISPLHCITGVIINLPIFYSSYSTQLRGNDIKTINIRIKPTFLCGGLEHAANFYFTSMILNKGNKFSPF